VVAVSSTYNERTSTDYAQPLYDLTSGTGYNFPAIREQRNSLAADFVTMYADRSEYCGIAWIGPSPNYAFSAINPACNGSATLAHELGHNMGLRHDRYVEAAASADVYNYGYVSTQAKVRDIMSYNNQCAALGISCQRVTYFSSPQITYNGYPLGIPKGTAGAADATRKLGENAAAVAAFR
jgi:Metallo-peptidase family M12B Reprolysin-like